MKIGFALEYSLGHITHAENLKRFLASEEDVNPVYIDIPFDKTPMPPLLKPILRDNWSVRASMAARRGLIPKLSGMSACFFHTQVTSLFSTDIMRRVPSVISLDATPLQYDSLGEFYKHAPGPQMLENVKKRLNENAFRSARHLITWSQWAKDSLERDYGVDAQKVTVIAPGIDRSLWSVDRQGRDPNKPVTFLFVGGDFERKGGPILLDAFRRLQQVHPDTRLLVVTKTPPEATDLPGVEIFSNLSPNSQELRELYAKADIFAFPTLGDCLPLAVMEALAAGLPVITSDVGALSEAVTDGLNGLVVKPQSDAFFAAMSKICCEADMRRSMAVEAVKRAKDRFDSSQNYRKLIDTTKNLSHLL